MEDKFSRSRAYKSYLKMVTIAKFKTLNNNLWDKHGEVEISLAGARITNLPPITMIASQAKHKQNRVCLIEVYYL